MAGTQAEIFGEKIVKAMADMSLSELARRAGLNRQQLHRYVHGHALPRADSFMKICDTLNLDPRSVLQSEDEANGPRSPRPDDLHLGNALNPSESQFPSGIYEIYSSNTSYPGKFTRLILIAENTDKGCFLRWLLPPVALPPNMPRAFRHMSGFAKVKFNRSYCVTMENDRLKSDEEALFVMLILEPEEPATNLRRGVSMRFVPFSGMQSFASKVAMRRLPDMSYRQARKLPILSNMEELPEPVQTYFQAPSVKPYHFGPTADVERFLPENTSVAAKTPKPRSANLLEGLSTAIGGASYPTEEEFPSGVYDLYATFGVEEPKILHIALNVSAREDGSRWAYSRLPTHFYRFSVPKVIREMSGPVLIKSGYAIHIFGVVLAADGRGNLSHYYRFGGLDFKSGARLGLVVSPDMSAPGPMSSRAVLIKSKENRFSRAFRKTAAIPVADAPFDVRDYFTKVEPAPHVLSINPLPQIF